MALTLKTSQVFGTPVFVLPDVSSQLKRIFGGVQNVKKKEWYFPAYYPFGELAFRDIETVCKNNLRYTDGVNVAVTSWDKAKRAIADRDLPDNYDFLTTPLDHQVHSFLNSLYALRSGMFLDPGLGKSKVATDVLRFTGERALILAPKVTLHNWREELYKHGGDHFDALVMDDKWRAKVKLPHLGKLFAAHEAAHKAFLQAGRKDAATRERELIQAKENVESFVRDLKVQVQGHNAWVTTYKTAAIYHKLFYQLLDYTAVVADESHKLRTYNSDTTLATHYLSSKARRRMILTGTAVLGDPRHLYGQFKFLGGFLVRDYRSYCNTYLEMAPGSDFAVVGFKNLHIINKYVRLFALQYTKEECLDLPARSIVDIKVDLSPEQKRNYNELVEDSEAFIGSYEEGKIPVSIRAETAIEQLGKFRQISGGFINKSNKDPNICDSCPRVELCTDKNWKPYTKNCTVVQVAPPPTGIPFKKNPKLEATQELLESLVDNGKVLIWAYYKRGELDRLCEMAEENGWGYVRVDGDTKNPEEARHSFQNDPDVKLYIAQIGTGIGITLNEAKYMVYYSVDLDLEPYLQSIDRNYRIGQDHNVTVYRLVANGTVDEYIYAMMDNKIDVKDTVTTKLECNACPHAVKCLKAKISPWDKDCVLSNRIKRGIIQRKIVV